MSHYFFIESRDPFESNDAIQTFQIAADLSKNGTPVQLFLIQNGVLVSRKKAISPEFQKLLGNKQITIYADDYSLEERGIQTGEMHQEIQVASASTLIDLVMDPQSKPIWH